MIIFEGINYQLEYSLSRTGSIVIIVASLKRKDEWRVWTAGKINIDLPGIVCARNELIMPCMVLVRPWLDLLANDAGPAVCGGDSSEAGAACCI